ncbi:MAG: DNA mismatch repair endonuclease MutL [Planctomycetes bacterium]|nr:DNA mismatch repair endonuclease MutL [Planctomycetota bacterium]
MTSARAPGVIRRLPPELVDRIAAGEVVERPASVVKELVENSLDAGATDVTVEIRAGGVELIAVRDDGVGIAPDDLPLAFASHATSKLSSIDDLDHIASFGFRGEALASVGAVADCRIVSRQRGATSGAEIESRGGEIHDVRPAASPDGTLVEVRGLFRYVPARRKFLRSAGAESSQVTAVVERAALANLGVGFTLLRDGRKAFRVARDDDRRERIAAFYGRELFGALLPIAAADGTLSVTGFAARPEAARPTAALQLVFLNGRPIRDRSLAHALRMAYEGLLTKGLQPVAFLFVSMDPADVDVNVHPAKTEVRFRDPDRVHRLVRTAVRDALLRADLAATVRLPGGANTAPAQPVPPRTTEYLDSVKDALTDFLTSPRAAQDREDAREHSMFPASREPVSNGPHAAHSPPPSVARPVARYLQVQDTYLVFETPNGLAIVDQHALHERIRLEELHERVHHGQMEVQRLLTPRVIELPAADAEMLVAEAATLTPLGIEIGAFGPTSVAVHALPALFGARDPGPLVRDLVERVREDRAPGHREHLVESILHSMACRSAVMAGDPLTETQIAELLRRADLIDTSGGCAHGRPTALRLSQRDLERHFKR